jgi:SAM-dependent methyltransferase
MQAGDVREDIDYKTTDHLFRSKDEYAQGKYDVTTRWLKPRLKPDQLLLNIGCGSGEYNAAAHAMGLRVAACEPETNAFELAAKNAPDSCRVFNSGLMELVGNVEPADFIVMHDVLEHIEDDVAAVNTVHELLAPGGVAVISVPAYQWLFGHHDVQLGHYRRYTKRSLLKLFRPDFKIEAARYYGAALIPVALWFSRISKKPYPVAGASKGIVAKAMRFVCQMESRIPMPMGTSVMIRVRRPT